MEPLDDEADFFRGRGRTIQTASTSNDASVVGSPPGDQLQDIANRSDLLMKELQEGIITREEYDHIIALDTLMMEDHPDDIKDRALLLHGQLTDGVITPEEYAHIMATDALVAQEFEDILETKVVLVHVYTVSTGKAIRDLNTVTQDIVGAGGVFHAAIEIEDITDGFEWSFGYTEKGTGVFGSAARKHRSHQYRETVDLGQTSVNRLQFVRVLQGLQREWLGNSYNLVRRNCCSFCNVLCDALGVRHLPGWVDRFARIGSGGIEAAETVTRTAKLAAQGVAAGAAKADESLNLTETTRTVGEGIAAGAAKADESLNISGGVKVISGGVVKGAKGVAAGAAMADEHLDISKRAILAAGRAEEIATVAGTQVSSAARDLVTRVSSQTPESATAVAAAAANGLGQFTSSLSRRVSLPSMMSFASSAPPVMVSPNVQDGTQARRSSLS